MAFYEFMRKLIAQSTNVTIHSYNGSYAQITLFLKIYIYMPNYSNYNTLWPFLQLTYAQVKITLFDPFDSNIKL